MIEIIITVNKANVYDEVAKTTSYTGVKMKDDDDAYSRIFTTDEDRMMLERFWNEACDFVTNEFKPFLVEVTSYPQSHGVELTRNYEVKLNMPSSFDMRLKDTIASSLFSYFVSSIVSKWYKFTNKLEAESYAADALATIHDTRHKLYYRRKPERTNPTINDENPEDGTSIIY